MKKYVYLSMALLIMAGIFYFSDQPGGISQVQSTRVMEAVGLAEKSELEDVKSGDYVIGRDQTFDYVSFTVRKIAHITVYFILTLSLILTCRAFGRTSRGNVFGSSLAVLYALSDELHQTFIFGRNGSLTDVLVDAIGIGLAAFLFKILDSRRKVLKNITEIT